MIVKAVKKKLIKEEGIVESLSAFKRSGASAIVTYFADKIIKYL